MRTYDDTFSGQRIYPGKVYLMFHSHSSAFPQPSDASTSLPAAAASPRTYIGYQTEQESPLTRECNLG